jgi:hypothetical protein
VRADAGRDSFVAAMAVTRKSGPTRAGSLTHRHGWRGQEGRVVIYDRQVARKAALRVGWNDAAWGQPRREVELAVTPWYERGYAGGLVFRQKRQKDTAAQDVLDQMPQIVPAG